MKKIISILLIIVGLGCIGGSFILPKEDTSTKKEDKKDPGSVVVKPTEEKWKEEVEIGKGPITFDDDLKIEFVENEEMSYTAKINYKDKTIDHSFHAQGTNIYTIYKIQKLYFFLPPAMGQFGQTESILIINSKGEVVQEFKDYVFNGSKNGELAKDDTTFELDAYDLSTLTYDEEGNEIMVINHYQYKIVDNNIEQME